MILHPLDLLQANADRVLLQPIRQVATVALFPQLFQPRRSSEGPPLQGRECRFLGRRSLAECVFLVANFPVPLGQNQGFGGWSTPGESAYPRGEQPKLLRLILVEGLCR